MTTKWAGNLFHAGTWLCVAALGVLSLLPADEMVRTGIGGHIEHFVAYAGSAMITVLGYGERRNPITIIAGFSLYSGLLELLQNFSPGRHPAFQDFAVSSLGALGGALAVIFLRSRFAAN